MTEKPAVEFINKKNYQVIVLNNPAQRNCLSPNMMSQIKNYVLENIMNECRFILLIARGEHFCAGADLNWMKEQKNNSLIENYKDTNQLQSFFKSLYSLPIPLISYVQGGSFGGGVGLAATCDYVFASSKATFCLSEVKLGLIPAVISPYVINKMGYSWFQAYSTSAKIFNASDAKSCGLVHEITDLEFDQLSIEEKSLKIANQFLHLSPQAMKANKKLIRNYNSTFMNSFRIEHENRVAITSLRDSEEGHDGMSALFEKRKPKWVVEEK